MKDEFRGQAALLLTTVLLILVPELLVLTSCSSDTLPSHRPTSAMAIDGVASDWDEIPLHRVKEMEGLVVGVANDDNYLYLVARSSDLQLARRLRMLGIIVRASGAGGSDLRLSYHGSVALSDNLMRAGGGPGGGRMPLAFETGEGKGLAMPGMIEVEQGGAVTRYAENRPEGPAAGSDVAGDVYCYEFRLPLDALFPESVLQGGVAGQRVQLEIQGGKMSREMRQQLIMLRNSRGNMGGGGGGREGGKGGGPGGPGSAGGQGNEPRKLKTTIKLS